MSQCSKNGEISAITKAYTSGCMISTSNRLLSGCSSALFEKNSNDVDFRLSGKQSNILKLHYFQILEHCDVYIYAWWSTSARSRIINNVKNGAKCVRIMNYLIWFGAAEEEYTSRILLVLNLRTDGLRAGDLNVIWLLLDSKGPINSSSSRSNRKFMCLTT